MSLLPSNIRKIISEVWGTTNPISIFLYGSRSRDDFNKNSDYEIGVLYFRKNKISRSELASLHQIKNLKIYPFVYEDFLDYKIDTPFPKTIYLKTLIETSKTIFGKDISKIIKSPKIKKIDLVEAIGFRLGCAYSAVVSSRQNDWVSTNEDFSKSVLFGFQILIFLETKKLLFSYKQIFEESKKIKLDNQEYLELIKYAIVNRNSDKKIDPSFLYKNISFLNSVLYKIKK